VFASVCQTGNSGDEEIPRR